MRKLIIVLSITLILFSCKKDQVETPCNSIIQLKQIKSENATVQELTYTNCNLYESVEEFSYKKYIYNQQNMLIKTEQALLLNPMSCFLQPGAMDNKSVTDPRKAKITQYYTYEYDNSLRLIKKTLYFFNSGNAQLFQYQTFEYDAGRMKRNNMYSPENQLTQYTLYTYDDNGNLINEDYYLIDNGIDFKLLRTKTYEYDNKYNPFFVFAVEGIPGIYTNKNNILKETSTYFYEGGADEMTIQYTMEYNELGYPSKINNRELIYNVTSEN